MKTASFVYPVPHALAGSARPRSCILPLPVARLLLAQVDPNTWFFEIDGDNGDWPLRIRRGMMGMVIYLPSTST